MGWPGPEGGDGDNLRVLYLAGDLPGDIVEEQKGRPVGTIANMTAEIEAKGKPFGPKQQQAFVAGAVAALETVIGHALPHRDPDGQIKNLICRTVDELTLDQAEKTIPRTSTGS
jgi:hypothetical protein